MGTKFFKNITPLLIICILGIILCGAEIITLFLTESNFGGLATGVLGFITVLLFILLVIDRYLIKRTEFKLLVILEIIFLVFGPFSYAFVNRKTNLNVQTNKNYFVVVIDKFGKRKKDFKFTGIVDQNVIIKNPGIIHLNSEFMDNPSTEVVPPWGGSFNAYLDTVNNSEPEKIQIYSNIKMDGQKDSVFNSVLKSLYAK